MSFESYTIQEIYDIFLRKPVMLQKVKQSLAQNINKIEVKIKTCHVTRDILCDFNLEGDNITLKILKIYFYFYL